MFDLALAQGRNASDIIETMPSWEFTYWLAYNRIDPFGSFREDWRTGQIAFLLSNIHRGKNKPVRPLTDFLWQDVRQARRSKLAAFKDFLKGRKKPKQ